MIQVIAIEGSCIKLFVLMINRTCCNKNEPPFQRLVKLDEISEACDAIRFLCLVSLFLFQYNVLGLGRLKSCTDELFGRKFMYSIHLVQTELGTKITYAILMWEIYCIVLSEITPTCNEILSGFI